MEAAIMEAPQVLGEPCKLLTAEEFYETCKLDRAELVNGEVIEKMPVGEAHAYIATNIAAILRAWARARKAGRVYVELGCVLEERVVRAPDVAFISSDQLKSEQLAPGLFAGAPTLAVEIVSPGDLADEIEAKVQEYLAAGVQAVWIVYPKPETVTVRTPDETHVYKNSATLGGDPVLPGFEVALSEIFE